LKLQGFVNNPRRTQDLEDIKALIANVSSPADGQPFAAGGGITHVPEAAGRDPLEALDDLMAVIEALCPIWPSREIFSPTDRFLI
jgi:hypothetical protein